MLFIAVAHHLLCLFIDFLRGNQTQQLEHRTQKTGIRGLGKAERTAILGVTPSRHGRDPAKDFILTILKGEEVLNMWSMMFL